MGPLTAMAGPLCYHQRVTPPRLPRIAALSRAGAVLLAGCSAPPSLPPEGGDGGPCPAPRAVTGAIDSIDGGVLSGWVRDDDRPEAAPLVQVFIDDVPVQRLRPDSRDADGRHRFRWAVPALGPGPAPDQRHLIAVYGNGVDCQGREDTVAELAGSPQRSADGCAALPPSAAAFCAQAPGYFQHRQRDTVLVGDAASGAQIGVSRPYGAAALQLRGADRDHPEALAGNLLAEHGALAVQLVIGGYGLLGGAGGPIDPAYGYEGADQPCDGRSDPRPPGRVTQAQGPGCSFATDDQGRTDTAPPVTCWASGDHDTVCVDFARTLRTLTVSPYHSTRQPAPLGGLRIAQWARAVPGAVRLRYEVSYDGAQAWSSQAQALPQIVSADGVAARVYSYLGSAPFTGGAVTALPLSSSEQVLRLPGLPEERYAHRLAAGTAREGWWCVCDEPEQRCLTVAALGPEPAEAQGAAPDSDEISEARLVQLGGPGGPAELSALGLFALQPGLRRSFAVYLLPYRYDQPIPAAGGQTPRQLIAAWAPDRFRLRSTR